MSGESAEQGVGFLQHKWFSRLVLAKRIGGGLHVLGQALPRSPSLWDRCYVHVGMWTGFLLSSLFLHHLSG